MARLLYAIFCEHHTTDDTGKNTYAGVFDTTSLTVKAAPGTPPPKEPLPFPVPSTPFVLAIRFDANPGAVSAAVVTKDPDNQVLGRLTAKLSDSTLGSHTWNIHFGNGIPVVKSGIYSFEIEVEGEKIGEAQLPIRLNLG